jgi:hypothetical protein
MPDIQVKASDISNLQALLISDPNPEAKTLFSLLIDSNVYGDELTAACRMAIQYVTSRDGYYY